MTTSSTSPPRRSSSVTSALASEPRSSDANIVVLRGTVAAEPVLRELPTGSVFEATIHTHVVLVQSAVREPVPVVWDVAVATAHAGDTVVVRGRVRQRFFRSGGLTVARTEVVASEIVSVRRRKAVFSTLARIETELARLAAE